MSVTVGRIGGGQNNPLGKVESMKSTITDSVTDLASQAKYMPWMSFSLYNDGSDPLYIEVNEESMDMDTPLNKGEDMSVDMGKRCIEKVLLICDMGKSAQVRVYAKA